MKTKNTAHTLLIFCLSLLTSTAFGQSNEWKLLHEEQGVRFYGMDTYCQNGSEPVAHHYAHLKIENTTSQDLKLNFGFALQFTEGCSGCDQDSEYLVRLDLPANSSTEGTCEEPNGKLTRIIRNMNLVGGWKFQSMKIAFPIID